MRGLAVVVMVACSVEIWHFWRDTWGWWSVGSDTLLPGFLEQKGRNTSAILRCDDIPERVTMSFVYTTKTLFVNAGNSDWGGSHDAIEAESSLIQGRIGNRMSRRGWLWENSNGVTESSRRAVGS